MAENPRLLTDLFRAYYKARRNKRNTINQLKFELHFEREIFKLYNEIEARTYKPLREIAFIVDKPIKREIFAANFRDRVVHHLLFGYLGPIIEKYLIHDCYSCRKGKGTSAGIQRAAKFLRSCSENYQKDCYVMKMDISGYFMSIDRELLYHKVNGILRTEYQKRALSGKAVPFEADRVDFLLQKTIFRNPADNCMIKGSRSDWNGLPANKSLFYAAAGCGLPIGNLTSQLFGNVFLNDFDHWMKQNMGFRHYGRYVDDCFVVHPNKLCLSSALPKIADFLKTNEKLALHPNKTKINSYKSGFLFLGAVIKPYRIYIANRVKGNFYQALEKHNRIIRDHNPTADEKKQFISSMNSYLGIMRHYKTYKIRKQTIKNRLSTWWWNLVFIKRGYQKFVLKSVTVTLFRMVCIGALACIIAGGPVFAAPAEKQDAQERLLTVNIEGVFSAKASLSPFKGLKTAKPIAEAPDVKDGESAKLKIPAEYLPGEFLLRLDYRAKETDHPYPSERIIFINKEDVELTVNPPYINNDERTKFNAGETENTVYSAFMKENGAKRMPIDLLRQFLLSYDRPDSALYAQGVEELAARRLEYNTWLSDQAAAHRELYVSRLFQFQYIPAIVWSGDEKERMGRILKNYFEGIDFSDPLIIRSRELSGFMDAYIRLHGMQATTAELRDSLFTRAGRVACEKASKGHPEVYGWMVDYFYTGYETNDIKGGMTMLQEHVNNPNCLTSKKQQIIQRLEGMKKLVPGAPAPDFTISDDKGNSLQFHKWKGKARHKLVFFWTTSCADCLKLVKGLSEWHNLPANKKKLDIIAVNLDEKDPQKWEAAIAALPGWKHFQAKGGVNSPAAREYAILSTPAMFLVKSKNNVIVSSPGNFEQLMKDLK